MTVPVLATGVRKARFQSTCPTCRGPVLVGQQIAKCSGNLWQHVSCFIANGGHRHHIDRPLECAGKDSQ